MSNNGEWLGREIAGDRTVGTTTIDLDWGNVRITCENEQVRNALVEMARDYVRLRDEEIEQQQAFSHRKALVVLNKINSYEQFHGEYHDEWCDGYGIQQKGNEFCVAVYLNKDRPEGLPDELDGVKLLYVPVGEYAYEQK